VIFHLAASVGNARSLSDPFADSETNVLGTLRILEAARHSGVRKVIVWSFAAIFGELRTLPIREDLRLEPESPYGVSKLAEEKMSMAYSKLYGRGRLLRLPCVLVGALVSMCKADTHTARIRLLRVLGLLVGYFSEGRKI